VVFKSLTPSGILLNAKEKNSRIIIDEINEKYWGLKFDKSNKFIIQ
jgi:hypothetical protein